MNRSRSKISSSFREIGLESGDLESWQLSLFSMTDLIRLIGLNLQSESISHLGFVN